MIKLRYLMAAALVALACSSGVVSPGGEIRGSLPWKTHTLAEMWPDAGSELLRAGHMIMPETYTESHEVSGSGIMVIDVRSHDFDPVAAVLDGEGRLVAFSDDWKGTTSARIVLNGAPDGGRLLVFSPDDSRGLYDVLVREGTQEELDSFGTLGDLNSGSVTGWVSEEGYNPYQEEILRSSLDEYIYVQNYDQALLHPFTLPEDRMVSLFLESDQFDPYLVLMKVENGEYVYVDYNDDYEGTYSRIFRELEAGDYVAMVMPYSTGYGGSYTLSLEFIDLESMVMEPVEALLPDVEYSSEIAPERNLAVSWWPGIMDSWEAPSFLSPFGPTACFTFSVSEPSLQTLTAHSEADICMTLLQVSGDSVVYAASNDDYPELGTDPRLVQPILPGEYIVLVSRYNGTDPVSVTFTRSLDEGDIPRLNSRGSQEVFAPWETPSIMYRLNLVAGNNYTVSVESQDLDPVINLYMPDGQILYDDDGGEGTNSMLTFTATDYQEGEAFLSVEKYSEGEGYFTISLSVN